MKLSSLLATLVVALFITSIAASTITSAATQPTNTSTKGVKSVPDKILVRFQPSIVANAAVYTLASDAASASIGATVVQQYPFVPGLEVVKLPQGLSANDAIAHYQANGNVAYAEPDFIASVTATANSAAITPSLLPNDPYYQYQWAYPDITASGAWDKTTGASSTVIADVDTGVDVTHPDLTANLIPGWNFVTNSADLRSDSDHGTHTAGIIGAVGNNGLGVTGTNWHTSILPLVAGGATGFPLDAIISSWQYARDHGATVINNSFGGSSYSQAEKDAIDACPQCLFVCAAGNAANDNDGANPFYPASYTSANIISVASIDSTDALSSWSNYGAHSVHLAAPGSGILSTVWMNETLTNLGPGYKWWDGTSMATAYVTGVAGLIKTVNSSLTVAQVKNAILNNVDPDVQLNGKVLTGGRLDAGKAVNSVVSKVSVAGAPAVCSQGANSLDLFVRGTDSALYWKHWSSTGWSSWTSLGGSLTSDPAAVSWSNGRIDVFARGNDGALYHKWFDAGWHDWERLSGVIYPGTGPAVSSWGSGRLDVFVEGMDGALYHKWFDNGWHDWERFDGHLTASPSAVAWKLGTSTRIDIFTSGSDFGLYQLYWSSGSGWSGWYDLGTAIS